MLAEELVEAWPKRWPRPTVGSTKNSHSQVKPFARFFAGVEVDEITREGFRRFALEHPGNARYARTMLYDALDAGIVDTNVAAGVKIPKSRGKISPPNEDDVRRLAEQAKRIGLHQFAAMILVSAYTGLREGEARALAIPDLNFDHRPGVDYPARIEVRHSINRQEQLVRPKTASSEGVCAVLGPARNGDLFREWKSPNRDETPVRPRRIFAFTRSTRQSLWDRVREETGTACRWHDLRHFCATWLLDQGATVDDVALQLRCSVDEVRKTYGHPDRETALSRLEGLVS